MHVPRFGGTSLGETLGRHACRIAWNALGPDRGGGPCFLDEIGRICRCIAAHETIHLTGPDTLRSLVDQRLIRFGDTRIRVRYGRRPTQPRPRSWRRALLRAIGGLAGRKPLPSG